MALRSTTRKSISLPLELFQVKTFLGADIPSHGGANGSTNSFNGAAGANSINVSGLFAALVAAGYATTSGGIASPTNSFATANVNHGGNATGFGCGGGSAAYWGGNGGNGLYGGGGGGAAGYTAVQTGGNGGAGVVVICYSP